MRIKLKVKRKIAINMSNNFNIMIYNRLHSSFSHCSERKVKHIRSVGAAEEAIPYSV